MKLLVFAHVPPPHHGQSYMVQLMLNGFGGDCRKSRNRSGGPQRPRHRLLPRGRAFFQKPRRHRRTPNRQSPVDFVLLPPGHLVPVPLRRDQFLLRARARQVRRALPRLAGPVPLPSVFQGNHFALARRRSGQMAGNVRPNPHPRGDVSRVQTGRPQHRHLQLQRRRRGKTFAAAHSRRQHGIPDPCPDFGKPFCPGGRRVLPRAQNCSRTSRSARPISKTPAAIPNREGFIPRPLHARKRAVCRRAGRGSGQPDSGRPEMPRPNETVRRR